MFYPKNEDEAEAYKTFRETGSPSGLNSLGIVVKVVTIGGIAGKVVYEIVRNPAVQNAINGVFTNGH